MKTFLLILLFSLTSFSQLPDLSSYEIVTTSTKGDLVLGAFVDMKHAEANGIHVKFTALLSPILATENGSPLIDNENFLISTFRADCTTRAYAVLHSSGRIGDKPFDKEDEPNTNVAKEGTVIYRLISVVCTKKVGVKV